MNTESSTMRGQTLAQVHERLRQVPHFAPHQPPLFGAVDGPEHLTADDVRRIVREELARAQGSYLVPTGAALRAEYHRLTGETL